MQHWYLLVQLGTLPKKNSIKSYAGSRDAGIENSVAFLKSLKVKHPIPDWYSPYNK